MDYKKLYYDALKNVCERDREEFDFIVEQDRPKFADKLIPNDKAPHNALYSQKLDEEVATEEDYKDFCEYVYGYIGMDFNEMINNKQFSNFGRK